MEPDTQLLAAFPTSVALLFTGRTAQARQVVDDAFPMARRLGAELREYAWAVLAMWVGVRLETGHDPDAGKQLDSDDRSGDDPGHGPADKHQGQVPPCLSLPPVAVQRAGSGDHVIQQVGRGDGRAGRTEHADLERQQEHRAGNPRGRGQRRDAVRGHQRDYLSPAGPEHLQ